MCHCKKYSILKKEEHRACREICKILMLGQGLNPCLCSHATEQSLSVIFIFIVSGSFWFWGSEWENAETCERA